MNFILFDDSSRNNLLPLTFTRPIADIRIGILTIREKWEFFLKDSTSTLTENYLSIKYPIIRKKNNFLINGSVCPTKEIVEQVVKLKPDQALVYDDYIIAVNVSDEDLESVDLDNADKIESIETISKHIKINHLWEIFTLNDQAILEDFKLLTEGRKSQKLSDSNRVIGKGDIFLEEGAIVECANLNTTTGAIYIGKNAEIMEGASVRGPLALCEHATIKMNAKVYGATTLGPWVKVGGEVSNSVIFGYSNKAHDGFLGNSVLGEWCNLGADTNNSNLKNLYDETKIWNYPQKKFIPTGLQFCGLIMGDHSKCGINTMFNTATVVGVNANIFGSGFQRNFIPSFTWGGVAGFTNYDIDKAIEVAQRVYKRRDIEFTNADTKILREVYKLTQQYKKL